MHALEYNATVSTAMIKCHKGKTEHNCIWLCMAYNKQTPVCYSLNGFVSYFTLKWYEMPHIHQQLYNSSKTSRS